MGEVVSLRESPLMSDIPGMLRHMADQIEKGEIEAPSVLLVIPTDEDWPDIYGWGEPLGTLSSIGLLELAKGFFVNNNTERATGG